MIAEKPQQKSRFRAINYLGPLIKNKSWSIHFGLLLLRLSCGLMILHGWSKFTDFSENSSDWPDPFYLGSEVSLVLTIFAELICTVFVLIGLFTRIALLPLLICMIVIVFLIHAEDSLADREHPIMYLLVYLTLLFTGPGKISIDNLIWKSYGN